MRLITCGSHYAPYKAQFGSTLFRCGYGCERREERWQTKDGWAVYPLTPTGPRSN